MISAISMWRAAKVCIVLHARLGQALRDGNFDVFNALVDTDKRLSFLRISGRDGLKMVLPGTSRTAMISIRRGLAECALDPLDEAVDGPVAAGDAQIAGVVGRRRQLHLTGSGPGAGVPSPDLAGASGEPSPKNRAWHRTSVSARRSSERRFAGLGRALDLRDVVLEGLARGKPLGALEQRQGG